MPVRHLYRARWSHTLIVCTVLGREIEYFSQAGFDMDKIHIKRNAPVSMLYEDAIRNEGAIISSSGALINFSGKKTGRSPKDKRIVYEETSRDDIWWGPVNIKMDERVSGQSEMYENVLISAQLCRYIRDQSRARD
jgi:phosphoenolpyruvate carboxykinase (ATP)